MGVAVVAAYIGAPRAAADDLVCSSTFCSFISPSRDISCEIDFQRGNGIPDQTYCQSTTTPESVTMSPDGELKTCTGDSCLGNPGTGTPILVYGDHAEMGPFSCNVETQGVTCTVASGSGFTISSSAIAPFA
jgi:hypothetical protein